MQIDLIYLKHTDREFSICIQKMQLFDSFGVIGLRKFIILDDEKKIEKRLSGLEKSKRSDNKLAVAHTNFSLSLQNWQT